MASLLYPDSGSRLVLYANGDQAVNVIGILYADSTLTALADIYVDNAGTPGALIANAQIRTDAYGRQPDYWGPADGTDHLWIVVNSGPPFKVDAAYGQRIDNIIATGETTVGAQTKATAAQTAATGAAAALAIVFGG